MNDQPPGGGPSYGEHTPAPPTYAPPPYGSPSGTPLRIPRDLAVVAIVVASTLAVVQLARLATAWPAAETYREAAQRGDSSWDVFTAYDAIGVLQLPVLLACYVVTCLWLHRCRTNVGRWAPEVHQARSPIWAWLGWWVPIVSFWFPFQLVRDVQLSRTPVRLGLWWTGWLVYLLSTRVADRMTGSTGPVSPEVADALPVVEVIATVALLVALVRWIPIVRRVTADQELLVAS
jgi:hypothetical protein